MDALVDTKNSAIELHKKIQEHLEELAQATDKARKSTEMIRYLNFCARFHQYSPYNVFLIMLSRPDATRVAGYNQWLKLGRYVKRTERGIQILAPLLHKDLDGNGKEITHLSGFKVAYVFDVSQTEGDPLPVSPKWKSPEKNNELNQRLVKFAESRGIVVTIEPLEADIQGMSLGGKIKISPEAGTKTIVHEVAHELLHTRRNGQSRTQKEMEAEAIAYAVSRYFGIEDLKSPNYIALHGVDAEQLKSRMEYLQATISEIITGIEIQDNSSLFK